jgi:hypothetical protein
MLLQYHSNILLIVLYILNKNNNTINEYNIIDNIILYNVSNVEEIYNIINNQIQTSVNTKINIKNNDIDLLFNGLIFPDLTCGTFYIENNRINPQLTICKTTKLKLANTEKNIDSQLFQSHNDYYAINHSMANNIKLTNLETRNLIIERILSLAYEFLEYNKFDFLGYIIHIIQDSWSGGHVSRSQNKSENTLFLNINQILPEIKNTNNITYILNEENLSYKNIANIINIILNEENNINLLLQYVKENKSIRDLINIIIDMLITILKETNFDNQKINIFLNNIIYDKSITNIINKKYIVDKKLNIENYNNNLDILNDLKYDDIPKKFLRIYKLIMNRLFTIQNLKNISSTYGNELEEQNFSKLNFVTNNIIPQISSFRYYVTQDHKIHILSDCKKNFAMYETSNYKYAIIDTLNIFNILLSTNSSNNTKLIILANYLLNYTYSLNKLNKNITIEKSDIQTNIDIKLKKVSHTNIFKCISKSAGYLFGIKPNNKNIKKYFKHFNKKKDLLYNNNDTFNNSENEEDPEMSGGRDLYYYNKYLKYKKKYLSLKYD